MPTRKVKTDASHQDAMAQFAAPLWNGAAPNAAHAMLIGMKAIESQIALWRHSIDLAQQLVRKQQDQALQLCCEQLSEMERALPAREGSQSDTQALFMPMVAAARAAEQMSTAVIAAQRDALEAARAKPN